MPRYPNQTTRTALLLAAAVLAVAGCATAPEPRTVSRIEVQEAVGFTIVEETSAGTDVRLDYQDALILLEQGRLDEGIHLLEAVAAETPELSAPRIDLGVAHHRAGNLEAAEQHLAAAIALNSEHPTAYNELGIVYRKLGRFAEARTAYESALDIYPGFHFARRNLAVLCDLYLVDRECALANYEAYMQTVPSDEEAAMWIADLRTRLGREE